MAAVGFEVAGSTSLNSVTSLTIPLTITTGTLLVVGAGAGEGSFSITGVTWNTVPLTLVTASTLGAGEAVASLWYLIAPATGTHDVVATASGSTNMMAGALSITGAHQTTPIRANQPATGATSTPSATVTSAVNDLVVDVAIARGADPGWTPGGGQTERVDVGTGTVAGTMSTEPGAASSVVMSWTMPGSASWAQVAASIQPVATGFSLVCAGDSYAVTGTDAGVLQSSPLTWLRVGR